MNSVIKVENLSKQYRLGSVSTGTFAHDINRWFHRVRGKEDPYLKIGETNDRSVKGTSDYVWALKDINFDVKHGEVLGIIGRNGAGKSTLLKILSRTTSPTTGSVKIKGRVASLLEVGTGFHPELSGRENIYLNGAILGMTKREINRKFDEIVDFAGVERYIDTPVKRYSSGMYVRLAFAVAAHLEPEILIVDEVLAVGDAEFQKKCLGKMKDVSVKEGRTVLFVSHNMAVMQRLCNRALLLENGLLCINNSVEKVVEYYLGRNIVSDRTIFNYDGINGETLYAREILIEDLNNTRLSEIPFGRPWQVKMRVVIKKETKHFIAALGIKEFTGNLIGISWTKPVDVEKGEYEIIFKCSNIILATGAYKLAFGLSSYEKNIHYNYDFMMFNISDVSDLKEENDIIRNQGVSPILNFFNIVADKKNNNEF